MRTGSSLVSAAAGKSAHAPCRLPWAAATEPMSVSQCSGSAACGGARSANQKECHLSYLAAQLRDPPVGRRVSIREVSTYLGHSNLASTLVYLHVSEISESRGREVQERLLHYALGS